MHKSVSTWVACNLLPEDVFEKTVAEVGSRDVNGSIQNVIFALRPNLFTGIDIQPGPRVNKICDAADLPSCGRFDLVVCVECLDHCEDWKAAATGMITALNPGGIWMLTTRSPGFPYHPHPGDHWRFTHDNMHWIILGLGLRIITIVPDPEAPGIFIKAEKPPGWTPECINLDGINVAQVEKPNL